MWQRTCPTSRLFVVVVGVWGLGFGVWGTGVGEVGEFRVWGLGEGLAFGFGVYVKIWCLGFRV